MLGIAALSVAFTGPGAISLDHAAGFGAAGVAWGLGAAVVALLAALGQLAQRYHPVGPADSAVEAIEATGSQAH